MAHRGRIPYFFSALPSPDQRRPRPAVGVAALLAMLLSACGPPAAVAVGAPHDPLFDDLDPASTAVDDPLEASNRRVLRFNVALDRWTFEPLTQSYSLLVPAPGRRALRQALSNLDSPSIFVNDVLQFEGADASLTVVRFAINTTFGLLGLFDVAGAIGLEGHSSDFGQTLALYGIPSGPYVVLPLLGPTTARDGTGYVVDLLFRPLTYLLGPGFPILYTSIEQGTVGLTGREAHAGELRALHASSMDYYASLRSAFLQNRHAEIWARRPDGGPPERFARFLWPARAPASGGEIVDATPHGAGESGETLALQD